MEIKVHGTLQGCVTPPPSKSQAHRLLICAALGCEPCCIVCNAVNDDIMATMRCLNALGAKIEELPDGLIVRGVKTLRGGVTVDAHNDHRIAMMAAVAATCCDRETTIIGAECVRKSYPNFWDDYEMLGGRLIREEIL